MKNVAVTVLGAGSWGIALANYLKSVGHTVTVWGRDEPVLEEISKTGSASKFFPEVAGEQNIATETELKKAISNSEVVVVAVPSLAVRSVAKQLTGLTGRYIISAVKGLEETSDLRMSEVLTQCLPGNRISVLTGPSFAAELLAKRPAAVTLAASSAADAESAREYIHSDRFRIYITDDLVGAELGGTVKNVLAVAAGVVDGANMGVNARAALLTRGLAEMRRLIVAAGGRNETVMGLSGMGDLILTATSDLSRNRRVGLALGRGGELNAALKEIGQVSEGVHSAKQVVELAKKYSVQMPISSEVLNLLEGRHGVKESVHAILSRAPGVE